MNLERWPLFDALEGCSSILLAGAGGGFDIYSGLPLYFALKAAGKEVHLANLSFAALPRDEELAITPHCVRVTADTPFSQSYFPEHHLSCWFRERHGNEVPIHAFRLSGVQPLCTAYKELHSLLELDAVVLVDGGTDSLMRGDEVGLGTPVEDMTSIAAVRGSGIPAQFLACIGFGVDFFHGICHAQFLESVAALSRDGAFLGMSVVLKEMPEGVEFLEAVEFANGTTLDRQSIVANSIASGIEGAYGDEHRTNRTAGSTLWINPLMPVYWAFELEAVAKRNLYLDLIMDTAKMMETSARIASFRRILDPKSWDEIPV